MRNSKSRNRTLEDELQSLLSKVCVEWGFCIPADKCDEISSRRLLTAGEFAAYVLEAEGMKPEYEVEWVRRFKRKFVEELGRETVAADEYE